MSTSKDTIQDIELEKLQKQDDELIGKGIGIAKLNEMSLSKFKNIISKHISAENNEDQWTFDYESYLSQIVFYYETPLQWGELFYNERWVK